MAMIGRKLVGHSVAIGAIGALSVVGGGLGVAVAANGGSLILGHSNHATRTTTLKNSHGTALALVGKKSKPPLTVNSSKQVKHLNASMLGGLTAAKVETAGSVAQSGFDVANDGTAIASSISGDWTLVASTAKLPRGSYLVTAASMLHDAAAEGSYCYIGLTALATDNDISLGGGSMAGFGQATEVGTVTLKTPGKVHEYCASNDTGATAFDASIAALRLSKLTTGSAFKPTVTAKATHDRGLHSR
jgi:hypothetical protein